MKTTYKIGTRGSLLAVTQAGLVKDELEKLSGKKFELVLIKTQGDEITNKPLWQLEGKDFFTKELDQALEAQEVDLVIHSYKDLGSIRPSFIKLAAITERKYAHDVLLIKKERIKELKNLNSLKVGTSSPRRIVNLTNSLKEYLPVSRETTITCDMLRGNVNTRIKKLQDGQYDAITLALAGVERLATGEGSRQELAHLLDGLTYFVLPQSLFPSAASQGALAVEINKSNEGSELESIIHKLHHPSTAEEIKREREAFASYGGGCHLAVGIHVKKVQSYFVHFHRGEVDGKKIEKKYIEGLTYPQVKAGLKFVGLPKLTNTNDIPDLYLEKKPLAKSLALKNKAAFVTTRYALPALEASETPETIWAAGTRTLKELVNKNFWVNGCTDSLGIEDLKHLSQSKALRLMSPQLIDWVTLTHDSSQNIMGEKIGVYERILRDTDEDFDQKIKTATAFYWTSFYQFETYLKKYPGIKEADHFCGLGKTFQEFHRHGIKVFPVGSMEDFYSL